MGVIDYRYYVVIGRTPPNEILYEMKDWIIENGIKYWHFAHNIDVPEKGLWGPTVRVWFDIEEDAIAFKLRWL